MLYIIIIIIMTVILGHDNGLLCTVNYIGLIGSFMQFLFDKVNIEEMFPVPILAASDLIQ